MNLASFTDVSPTEESSLRDFLDANALAHETIYNTLLWAGTIIAHYPLWAPGGIDDDWLLTHDDEHKAIALVLGLPLPPDLGTVDMENEAAAQSWFENHAGQHSLIAISLNI